MKKIILFVSLLGFSFFCFSQKIDSLKIGFGGGFIGNITVYKIMSNKVFKGQGLYNIHYFESTKFPRKAFKMIIKKSIYVLNGNESFSYPYNTYRFLEIYSSGKVGRYKWGDPEFEIPSQIKELYNYITTEINILKFT